VVVHTPPAVREWFDRTFLPQSRDAVPASPQISEIE